MHSQLYHYLVFASVSLRGRPRRFMKLDKETQLSLAVSMVNLHASLPRIRMFFFRAQPIHRHTVVFTFIDVYNPEHKFESIQTLNQ